jgi:hypothetical protein
LVCSGSHGEALQVGDRRRTYYGPEVKHLPSPIGCPERSLLVNVDNDLRRC